MPVLSETNNLGDLLKYEAAQLYSRDAVTIASGQNLALGTVVGIKTTDGKVYELDPAATDGTENVGGILIQSADATDADTQAVIITRHAIVADTALLWPTGITDNQKTTAIAQLKTLGILIRQGV